MRKKIKILYTIPNFDTAGSGKVVYDLVNNLDRSIFEPEICCFHDRGPFFKQIKSLGVPIHLFPFAINYRPFITFPFRLIKIIKFFKSNKFDIIHSWHWSSDFSEPLAAKISGTPYVFTKKSMGWGNKAWKWRSNLSSKIITINSDMLAFYTGKISKKVVPIPLGVNTSYYTPSNKKDEKFLNQLNIKPTDFVIISVVNLIPVKGIELLIKAIIKLNTPEIKLLIVGHDTGSYAQSLKQLAKGQETILFLGKKIDVRPYHSVADLFVIPTLERGEGLPVAPLEAMASGKIVIGSNVSGVKDILRAFPENIFNPNDVNDLTKHILKIKNMTQDERKQMELKMRNHIEQKYSLQHFITKHTQLYLNIVKTQKST